MLLDERISEATRAIFDRGAVWRSLTRREREVVEVFAKTGGTNRQIAEELGVATATVRTYVQIILRKLDVRTRAGIIVWYYTWDVT